MFGVQNSNDWIRPKKTAKPTTEIPSLTTNSNRFASLPEVSPKSSSRIPPVVMEITGTHGQTIDLIKSITKTSNFSLRYTGRGNVSVHCTSLEHRAILIEGLKGQRAFHTFTTDEDKTVKSVLRGLPSVPVEDISEDLQKQGLNVVKVSKMITKETSSRVLYLVQFTASTTGADIKSVRYVCFTKAFFERYRKSNARATQCFRCQTYGHAAKNCHRLPRCVKCAANHPTAECPKERETPARCAGCEGDHPANYRNCPRRVEYVESTTKRQQKPVAAAAHPSINLGQHHFPPLRKSQPAPAPAPRANKASYAKAAQDIPTEPSSAAPASGAADISISDLRKMMLLLQEIRVKAGKCASKMDIALLLVEYLDELF